ncbi:hypothetical protein [Pseudomonas sp. RGM2987]|uniref:hypothetical protein n=1 Tax=Pseudomonas sp. RGM2987 TaxID=2930090 RepID=UPI001FD69422|nr:hypothetical protein [Pseudomonas sp. RGM2987]MCJ8207701.1 hypothetical protein [Pseudomonas sp. RGM2987]
MSEVIMLTSWGNKRSSDNSGGGDHTGGENPPGGGDMEARVAALEKSLPEIKEKLNLILVKVESIDKHSATKADLANTELSMLKWCVATAIAMTGLACAITFGLTKLFSGS